MFERHNQRKEQYEKCGPVLGDTVGKNRQMREGRGTFEDAVSFGCGMFSCVFLFGEATHSPQKLAGKHMLLTAG
ncbi:hypothetical protein GOODEAATRI_001622 [Goodea atripinnis]|uniref:Uncharacterized protein n=1 Tax=Goodea atripinnis TaxID=208336 RepID=A0ABV0ME91_9TELE